MIEQCQLGIVSLPMTTLEHFSTGLFRLSRQKPDLVIRNIWSADMSRVLSRPSQSRGTSLVCALNAAGYELVMAAAAQHDTRRKRKCCKFSPWVFSFRLNQYQLSR